MAKTKNEGVAVGKRIKINKMQQHIILSVLGASVAVGACIVLSIFFIQYIIFNSRVIGEKNLSIENYKNSYANIDTLKSEVKDQIAYNADLESVARTNANECYDASGKTIDFAEEYDKAEAGGDEQGMEMSMLKLKMCSALRVVPDALPASRNEEALMASLNKIFSISDWEPETLSPSTDELEEGEEGDDELLRIPVKLSMEADNTTVLKVMRNLEKSIRVFNVDTAKMSWTDNNLEFNANATAYYTEEKGIKESTETLYADRKKEVNQTEAD